MLAILRGGGVVNCRYVMGGVKKIWYCQFQIGRFGFLLQKYMLNFASFEIVCLCTEWYPSDLFLEESGTSYLLIFMSGPEWLPPESQRFQFQTRRVAYYTIGEHLKLDLYFRFILSCYIKDVIIFSCFFDPSLPYI